MAEVKEKHRGGLSAYEQETIINFNKDEEMASIFTYEGTWQAHLEKKLGLKPIMDNGFGGREYLIPKKRIPKPRSPRQISAAQKKAMVERLAKQRSLRGEAHNNRVSDKVRL